MPRCSSPFCITEDGLRGRKFEPPAEATGLTKAWCPECIQISKQLQFFSAQTADMIRAKWQAYDDTNLPHQVKLFLKQYTIELLKELNQEL